MFWVFGRRAAAKSIRPMLGNQVQSLREVMFLSIDRWSVNINRRRHGAGVGLISALQHHGSDAGKCLGTSHAVSLQMHREWLVSTMSLLSRFLYFSFF